MNPVRSLRGYHTKEVSRKKRLLYDDYTAILLESKTAETTVRKTHGCVK